MQHSQRYSLKKRASIPALFIMTILCSTAIASYVTDVSALSPSVEDYETWYAANVLHFYGEGAKTELNISVDALLNGTFTRSENVSFHVLNKLNITSDYQISGVSLWTILEQQDLLQPNATCIKFFGKDGYNSYNLPLRIFENSSDKVFIVTQEDGQTPVDGPLKVAVRLDAIQNDTEITAMFEALGLPGENSVHNSKYSVKMLTAIEINCDVLDYATSSPSSSTTIPTEDNNIPGLNSAFLMLFVGIGIVSLLHYHKRKMTSMKREDK
ncbi:MAG: hypothetical protein ACTSWW_06560 [Promethearchaeota archaeon]